MSKEKTGTARQLTAGDKVKVVLWVNANRELCEKLTADQLAEKFKAEHEVNVSPSTMLLMRKEVFPDLRPVRKPKLPGGKHNFGQWQARVKLLEHQVSELLAFRDMFLEEK